MDWHREALSAIQKRRHPCPVFPIRWKRLSKERPQGSWRTSLRRAALCLCVSIGTLPLLWGAIEATDSRAVAAIGFAGTAVVSLVGAWFACVTFYRAASARPPRATYVGLGGAALLVVHGGMALLGMFAALLSAAGGRGRQLRRFGRVLLPRLVPGSDWSRRRRTQSRSTSAARARDSRRNGGRTPAPSTRRWARSPGSTMDSWRSARLRISSRPRTATASTRFATRRCAWGSPPPSTASIGALRSFPASPQRPRPCRGRESWLSRGSRSIRSSTACCTKASPLACSRAWPAAAEIARRSARR